jgi:hypothetical protein
VCSFRCSAPHTRCLLLTFLGTDNPPAGNAPTDSSSLPAAQREKINGTTPIHIPFFPPLAIPLTPTDPLPDDKTEKDIIRDDTPLPQAQHSPTQDRRLSREWDASKVPPSQFQRPKGSIYATPSTRDGHVGGAERDQRYWDKLKEKVGVCGVVVLGKG